MPLSGLAARLVRSDPALTSRAAVARQSGMVTPLLGDLPGPPRLIRERAALKLDAAFDEIEGQEDGRDGERNIAWRIATDRCLSQFQEPPRFLDGQRDGQFDPDIGLEISLVTPTPHGPIHLTHVNPA